MIKTQVQTSVLRPKGIQRRKFAQAGKEVSLPKAVADEVAKIKLSDVELKAIHEQKIRNVAKSKNKLTPT